MKKFDGRRGRKLSKDIVANLRFFGFYIGNQTILSTTKWGIKYDITEIFESPDAIGDIYALKLFRSYSFDTNYQKSFENIAVSTSSTQLIGEYISSLNGDGEFSFPLKELHSENSMNWRDVMVRFFRDLGNRQLNTEPLKDYEEDYAYWIISEGGYLERLSAIIANVIRVDKDYNVINEEWVRYRGSQFIRLINDETDTYSVKPPFKDWETMLWM